MKSMLLVLDSNEYIFGLTKVGSFSEQLLRTIPDVEDLKVAIPEMVIEETIRNLRKIHSKLPTEFYSLVYGYDIFITFDEIEVPITLIEKYKTLGLPKEADAIIGAFTEWVNADYLISENSHFLQDLKPSGYEVKNAQEIIRLLTGRED